MNLFGNEGDKTMELSFDDEDNKDGNENFVHKLEKGIVTTFYRRATWHTAGCPVGVRMETLGVSWMWRSASHPGIKGGNAHIGGKGLSL